MKFRHLALGTLLSCSFLFTVNFAAADTSDDLITALDKGLSDEYTVSATAAFSAGDVVNGTARATAVSSHGDMEIHKDYTVHFDMSSLPDDTSDEMLSPKGTFMGGEDAYYRKTDNMFWWRIRDLNLNIEEDASGSHAKTIGEGFFELVHFIDGKYILFNLNDFQEMLGEMHSDEEAQVFMALGKLFENQEQVALDMLGIIFDSGVLEVRRVGENFMVILQHDPKQIQPEVLLDLGIYFGMTAEEISAEKADFSAEDRADFEEEWAEMVKNVKLEIEFMTVRGAVTGTKVGAWVRIEDTEYNWNEETGEYEEVVTPIEFTISAENTITAGTARIVFPSTTENVVNFSKFFKAIKLQAELQRKRWESWEAESMPTEEPPMPMNDEGSLSWEDEMSYSGTGEITWENVAAAMEVDMEVPNEHLSTSEIQFVSKVSNKYRSYVKYLIMQENGAAFVNAFKTEWRPRSTLNFEDFSMALSLYSADTTWEQTGIVSKEEFLNAALQSFLPELTSWYGMDNWDELYTAAYNAGITSIDFGGHSEAITVEEAFSIIGRLHFARHSILGN